VTLLVFAACALQECNVILCAAEPLRSYPSACGILFARMIEASSPAYGAIS
jgi:hypothetical protein